MKERDIIYENGQHWVTKINGLYYIMENGFTHSVSQDIAYKDISIAIAYADYSEKKRKGKFNGKNG